MIKRYLLTGLCAVIVGMTTTLFAGETEIKLKDSTTSSGFSVKDGSDNTLLRVQGDGNVGIGTTNPGQKLSVAGTLESTSGGFKFPDGTTQTTAASASNAGVEFATIGSCSNVGTTIQNCGSIILTAPTSGFVSIQLSGFAVTFGANTTIVLGVGTSPTSFIQSTRAGLLDGTDTIRREFSLSVTAVVNVNAGNNTFFVLAQKPSVFSAQQVNLADLSISAIFIPNRF